jgi:hypothetical protein
MIGAISSLRSQRSPREIRILCALRARSSRPASIDAADRLRALFAAAHELIEAQEFCALPFRVLLAPCFLICTRQHESQRRAIGRQPHTRFELHD